MPELTEDQKLRYEAASVHHLWSAMRNLHDDTMEENLHQLFAQERLGAVLLINAASFAEALAKDLDVTLTDRDVIAFWAYKISDEYQTVIDAITDEAQDPNRPPVPTTFQTSDEVYELLFGGAK